MLASRSVAVGVALLAGCSVLNDASDLCEVSPDEMLINQAGDGVEHLGQPDNATLIADGRIMAAFGSMTPEGTESEVRISILDPVGGRLNLCNSDSTEMVVSDPVESAEQPSYRPSIAPVPFSLRGRGELVAAVGWSVGTLVSPDADFQIRYVDAAGCRIGDEITPLTDVPPPVSHVSLAWSEARGALLAVFLSRTQVWGAWFSSPEATGESWVLGTEPDTIATVIGGPAVALGPEGQGIVAWARLDVESIDEGPVFVVRAVLIDEDGQPREAVLANGAAAPFTVVRHADTVAGPFGLAVAAAADRYAVLSAGATTVDGEDRVWLRELDARDGNPLSWEGAPDGESGRIDTEDDGYQGSPAARYLPDGTLLVLWESFGGDGTVGRLLDVNGRPRFNGLTCDSGVFSVGERGGQLPGPAAPLVVGNRLWIFHAGDPVEDPIATAVMGWSLPLSELRPGQTSSE